MGLFGGSKSSGTTAEDPEIRQVEKMIATEAKNEQKNLDHALKDLSKLDKTHEKAIKAADKAQHAVDKAVKDEHKTAEALNQAEHKHDNAIAGQRNACKTLELKRQDEGRLDQDVQQHKLSVDGLQQSKAANDATRESKLNQIRQQATNRARAGSVDSFANGPGTGGRTSVDDSAGEHGMNGSRAQGAGTGTMGVHANGSALGAGNRA
ncbi:hypothetical protein FOMPIDRAFT_1048014 [Fomitopsis schrenkii]|uniref:Uncharacterized protein n=1 Tax=Fomitopsis schrenkii TaxID=2126942 RepID=S8ECI4_FOMSC|nr:hypothetical protein FOMPIDRAFT_1048014 [Fomitopsis schrenkii]